METAIWKHSKKHPLPKREKGAICSHSLKIFGQCSSYGNWIKNCSLRLSPLRCFTFLYSGCCDVCPGLGLRFWKPCLEANALLVLPFLKWQWRLAACGNTQPKMQMHIGRNGRIFVALCIILFMGCTVQGKIAMRLVLSVISSLSFSALCSINQIWGYGTLGYSRWCLLL